MWIAGWQKLSLVDYPDKVACTLFTGGCNLRCPYCHNSELVAGNFPRVDENEITSYLDKRQNILDGVVISGGEPCMQPDLLPFLRELKKRQLLIKLDTNGCYPAVLEEILQENLADYVAMDFKTSPQDYPMIAGNLSVDFSAIARSLRLLLSKTAKFELRTTVVTPLHTEKNFIQIRDYLLPLVQTYHKKIPAFYLQAFKDTETVPFGGFTAPDKIVLEKYAMLLEPVAERVNLRGV